MLDIKEPTYCSAIFGSITVVAHISFIRDIKQTRENTHLHKLNYVKQRATLTKTQCTFSFRMCAKCANLKCSKMSLMLQMVVSFRTKCRLGNHYCQNIFTFQHYYSTTFLDAKIFRTNSEHYNKTKLIVFVFIIKCSN